MSKRIECTICGATIMSFSEPDEVEPDRLFALLEQELAKHRDVIDAKGDVVPVGEGTSASPETVARDQSATWSRTLHLFIVVDEDNEAEDLEEELETPELFYFGDMAGWW